MCGVQFPRTCSWGKNLLRYVLLYLVLYAGWGVLTPFLPAVLLLQGANPTQIGVILSAAIAVRLVATPAVGIMSDRLRMRRQVLAVQLGAAAVVALGYGAGRSFAALLLIGLGHAAVTGSIGPLPDAMAVPAARWANRSSTVARRLSRSGGRDYGIVRGAGAAGFIAGSAIAGPAIAAIGSPAVVLWLNAGLFTLAAAAALRVPLATPSYAEISPGKTEPQSGRLRAVLRIAVLRRLLLVSGLIQGSHAFYTAFGTLRWQSAGVSPNAIGLLWSISVAAE